MNNNNNSNNSRRSALKKIAATSGLILGLPLANIMWANPTSGVLETSEDKESLAPLFPMATTCAMLTTNSTTRPLFASFGPTTSTTTTGG